jgi:DNA-binding transcriptional ArsR family regulator
MEDPLKPPETPVTEVLLDRRNVRGLAHPLRIKMLGLLREHGPATATGLAQRLGESSGATSYHLRQLAQYGFIVEAEGMGTRRQRWWRAAHQMTSFDLTGDVGDEEQTLGLEYLRGVAAYNCAAIVDWVDGLAQQPKEWSEASTISDWLLRLTPTQTSELMTELTATLERYRSEVSDTMHGEQSSVIVQLQVLPRLGAESDA